MHLEVRHLELVEAIHEERSITGASTRLFLTQSSLSHQLKNLEDRLGAQLFERKGRAMHITLAGERLLASASTILQELRSTEREITALAGSARGVVRLSTECYTCYWWLPRVLKGFNKEFPDVQISIELEASRRPLDALLSGRLDVAIVNRKVTDGRLHARPLFEDEVVAVLPLDHPYAKAEFMPIEAFRDEHLFLHRSASESEFVQRHLVPVGVVPKKISSVLLTEAILEFVEAGFGVAALARWVVSEPLKRREVAAVRIGKAGIQRQWFAVTKASAAKTRYMQSLLRHLSNNASHKLIAPAAMAKSSANK
jgi:LysR family transcriptional regulator for metE and metH